MGCAFLPQIGAYPFGMGYNAFPQMGMNQGQMPVGFPQGASMGGPEIPREPKRDDQERDH